MFTHESGIHVDGLLKDRRNYESFRPEEVGSTHRLVLGKHSGSHGVRMAYARLGLETGPALVQVLLVRIRDHVARTKRAPSERDLIRFHAEALPQATSETPCIVQETSMQDLITQLKALSSAEDFLGFFGVPFDERVVQVNRLHILKRFYQYLHRAEGLGGLDDVALFRRYRELLTQAYQDFVASSASARRSSRSSRTPTARSTCSWQSLRDSLADRRAAA